MKNLITSLFWFHWTPSERFEVIFERNSKLSKDLIQHFLLNKRKKTCEKNVVWHHCTLWERFFLSLACQSQELRSNNKKKQNYSKQDNQNTFKIVILASLTAEFSCLKHYHKAPHTCQLLSINRRRKAVSLTTPECVCLFVCSLVVVNENYDKGERMCFKAIAFAAAGDVTTWWRWLCDTYPSGRSIATHVAPSLLYP